LEIILLTLSGLLNHLARLGDPRRTLQNLLQLDLILIEPHRTVILPIVDIFERAHVVLASRCNVTVLTVLAIEWRVRITAHELVLFEQLIQVIVVLLEGSACFQWAQRLEPILSQMQIGNGIASLKVVLTATLIVLLHISGDVAYKHLLLLLRLIWN
jgi:hypothetical protein